MGAVNDAGNTAGTVSGFVVKPASRKDTGEGGDSAVAGGGAAGDGTEVVNVGDDAVPAADVMLGVVIVVVVVVVDVVDVAAAVVVVVLLLRFVIG